MSIVVKESCHAKPATVADYLLTDWQMRSTYHLFGVPGDYNLQFLTM